MRISTNQPSDQRGTDALLEMSVAALGRALRDGTLSPVELAEAAKVPTPDSPQ